MDTRPGGFSKSRGFTLVETLIAVSIFTVSILGLLSVLTQGSINSKYAKQKLVASYLAQEGIEYVRNMRDTYVLYDENFVQFRNKLNSCTDINNACGFDLTFPHDIKGCNQINDCKLYINNGGGYDTLSSGTYSGFVRKVWKENVGTGQDHIKIHSDVSWVQGSGSRNIRFTEDLFDWAE